MSITVSNCIQICNAPHNNSKSKMLYSFTKAPRFPNHKNVSCDKFYQKQSTKTKRATNFGYGSKFDFTTIAPKTPPPNLYNILNEFDKPANKKKGFGFGEGRDQMIVTGPYSFLYENKNPSPCTYIPIQTRCKTAYTMKSKLSYDGSIQKCIPGPGTYNLPEFLSENGRDCESKLKNPVSCIISPHSLRFKAIDNQTPGPGKYIQKQFNTSPQGKYCLSRVRNTPAYRFKKNTRQTGCKTFISPGPAQYQAPSQFGQYVAQAAFKQTSKPNHIKKVKANKQNILKQQ